MFIRSRNTGCWNCGHIWKLKRSFGSGTGVNNLVSWLWDSSIHSCFLNQMTFHSGQYCKFQVSYVIYNIIFMLQKCAIDHLFLIDRNHLTVMAQGQLSLTIFYWDFFWDSPFPPPPDSPHPHQVNLMLQLSTKCQFGAVFSKTVNGHEDPCKWELTQSWWESSHSYFIHVLSCGDIGDFS